MHLGQRTGARRARARAGRGRDIGEIQGRYTRDITSATSARRPATRPKPDPDPDRNPSPSPNPNPRPKPSQASYEAAGGYAVNATVARVLKGLGFSDAEFDRPCASFSGGWQMRIGLARRLL